MAKGKRVSFIRGKRMRATRLDANGRAVYGDSSVVTTKGFVSIGYTTNTEEGEAINVTNAGGDSCVAETATPTFTGFTAEIEFCEVDFALFEILTGQDTVTNDEGVVVGITESTDVDLTAVNFALEVWLGADTKGAKAAVGSQGQWGYVLTPFLGGGVIGDVTIENGAITFTVGSMSTKNGSAWAAGPYDVELVNGEPAPLRVPLKANDHRRTMIVEVAPPEVYGGATPLLDRADPAITSVSATVTGTEAAFTPTPVGTDPVFYDLGDGTWEYAETGSYSHDYEVAGTYTVTAKRGTGTATTTVTIPSA